MSQLSQSFFTLQKHGFKTNWLKTKTNVKEKKKTVKNGLFLFLENCLIMEIDLNKIKAIPIENFMLNIGYEIKSVTAANVFFNSPFRSEKTASFSVWKKKNWWKDFGSGESGDIIELAKKVWNVDFKEAISRLNSSSFSTINNFPSLPRKGEIVLKKTVDKVNNKALLDYMMDRSLTPKKIEGLVGEIYYLRNDKNYFGLAFKNDLGGYEIRNKYFKGCYGTKHFTTIQNGFDSITIFEGFIDFLSIKSKKELKSDVLVLNSCSLVERALQFINNYHKVFLMLDNDKAGNEATTFFINHVKGTTIDLRYLYDGFQDVNHWLIKK